MAMRKSAIPRDAMKKVQRGVITVEEAKSLETDSTSSKACSSTRLHLALLVTNAERCALKMDDAYILINEKKLSSLNELLRS